MPYDTSGAWYPSQYPQVDELSLSEDEDNTPRCGDHGCNECYPDGDPYDDPYDDDGVLSYDYRPEPQFFGKTGKGKLFLGIELEFELNGATRRQVCETVDEPWIYLKEDGSLDRGLEMVTHPISPDFLKENIGTWFDITKQLRKLGCRSRDTDTCGMHVHLSRGAFTAIQQYKLFRLVYESPKLTLVVSERGCLESMSR